jgi:hypothetical protein
MDPRTFRATEHLPKGRRTSTDCSEFWLKVLFSLEKLRPAG